MVSRLAIISPFTLTMATSTAIQPAPAQAAALPVRRTNRTRSSLTTSSAGPDAHPTTVIVRSLVVTRLAISAMG